MEPHLGSTVSTDHSLSIYVTQCSIETGPFSDARQQRTGENWAGAHVFWRLYKNYIPEGLDNMSSRKLKLKGYAGNATRLWCM
jgi:hypothetical protein